MYQNYIFDLYGTLVDIHTDEEKPELWEKLALFYGFQGAAYEPEEIRQAYCRICEERKEKSPVHEYKEIELIEVFEQLYEDKNVTPSKELVKHTAHMFRILSMEYIRLYEGVRELLALLRENKKNIYVLSNAQRVFTEYEMRLLHIYDLFDGVVISSDIGIAKPGKEFFENIVKRYQLRKEETIMVGNDAITDIFGATNAGMDSFYIHSNLSPDLIDHIPGTYASLAGNILEVAQTL